MNASFVISIQALFAILISAAIIKCCGMGSLFGPMSRSDIEVGAMLLISMTTSSYSLNFVNYPFMVLAKSAKILPIILIGWIRGIYKLTRV